MNPSKEYGTTIAAGDSHNIENPEYMGALLDAISIAAEAEKGEFVIPLLLQRMCISVSATSSVLYALSDDGRSLIPRVGWGKYDPDIIGRPYPVRERGEWESLLSGKSDMLSGYSESDETNFLAVPVRSGGKISCILELKREERFFKDEKNLVHGFANIIGMNYYTAGLAKSKAVMDEGIKKILDMSSFAAITVSADGTVMELNPQGSAFTGYGEHEIKGSSIKRLLMVTPQGHVICIKKNGEEVPVSITSLHFSRGEGDVILHLIKPPQDEDKIMEYRDTLEGIITRSPFGILVTDSNGNCVTVNDALVKMLDIKQEHMVNKYNLLEDPLLESHGLMPRIKRVYDSGDAAELIIPYDISRLPKKVEKPHIKILRMILFPVMGPEHKIKNVIAVIEDLTERKAMEKDVLERTRELAILNEVSRLIVSTATLDELIDVMVNNFNKVINADNCYITLYDEDERKYYFAAATADVNAIFSGQRFDYSENDKNKTLSQVVMESKKPLAIEDIRDHPLCESDRRLVKLLGIKSLLVLPMFVGNKFIGTISVDSVKRKRKFKNGEIDLMMTITNQASIMIERAKLFGELLSANKQILKSYEKLRDFDKMKTDFITITSHELRTPLTSIHGYTELMKDGAFGPLTGVQKDKLRVIDRNVNRMMTVVENLSELSQSGSISFDVKKERASIYDIVDVSVSAIRPVASSKNIDLTVKMSPGLPSVCVDKSKIIRVIDNLLDNAVKFTPPGGRICVYVSATPKNVHVEVKDTGIGIPEEDLKKIFTGFYRVGYRPSYQYTGVGIGLAIAKGIVEAHDGSIWAESKVNAGSTFHFTIPRCD
ncbi:sensor histidine kinase [Methanooceanicella nereidis]|uniref:sensor histidine kinase n=1 Tax=Methanooceanicella nereidis TaxID=2052831 RepID=UPI001E58DB3A|nr:ATP-binding protein [Methanocella sp. CWC-04]